PSARVLCAPGWNSLWRGMFGKECKALRRTGEQAASLDRLPPPCPCGHGRPLPRLGCGRFLLRFQVGEQLLEVLALPQWVDEGALLSGGGLLEARGDRLAKQVRGAVGVCLALSLALLRGEGLVPLHRGDTVGQNADGIVGVGGGVPAEDVNRLRRADGPGRV